MMVVGTLAPIPKSRLSKQMATNDDAAANEEEVEEQIEEENVEKTARENETGAPIPMMRQRARWQLTMMLCPPEKKFNSK